MKRMFPFLLVMLIALLGLRPLLANPIAPDSYLHMGIGKYILEFRDIPSHSELSYKQVDSEMELISHSWLADILIYWAASTNQIAGALLLAFPLLVFSLYLLDRTLLLLGSSNLLRVVSTSLAVALASIFWKFHPLIFAATLTVSLIYLYFKWKLENSKLIWFSVPVFLLFANIAGGYIFIPGVFYLLVLASEIIQKVVQRFSLLKLESEGELKTFFLAYVCSLVASLLNPLTFQVWRYSLVVLELRLGKWISSLSGVLVTTNSSLTKDAPSALLFALFLALMLFVVIALLVLILREKDRFARNLFLVLPLLFSIYLGFVWVRFIPLATLGLLPVFAVLVSYLSQKVAMPLLRPRAKILSGAVCGLTILALIGFAINPPAQFEFNYPKAQVEYIVSNNLKPKVLPTLELSGYLFYSLYPLKGYLDAQDDLFDENDVIGVYSTLETVPKGFFDNIVATYGVKTVVATKNADYLNSLLTTDEDWALLFLHQDGLVYARKDSLPEKFIEENELRHIDLSRNLGFNPDKADEAAEELEKFISKYPGSTLATGQLASIYRVQGNFAQAEATLLRIPKENRDFSFMTEMGRVQAAQGFCESAESWFLRALELRKEQNVSRVVLDLAVLYAACFNNKERATHFFERYNSYPLPPAERKKVEKLMKDFGVSLER